MQTVIGLFKNTNAAQEAKQQLLSNGFDAENIDVSTADEDYGTDESYLKEPEPINIYQDNASSDFSMNASTTGTLKYPSVEANSDTLSDESDTAKDESFGTKVSNFFNSLFGTDDDQADRYSKAVTKKW